MDAARKHLLADLSTPRRNIAALSSPEKDRIRRLGDPFSLSPPEHLETSHLPRNQQPLRFLSPPVAAPFMTAVMLERGIPVEWPMEQDTGSDELGEAGFRRNRDSPRPYVPLLTHFRHFCTKLTDGVQPGPKRVAWVEKTFPANPETEKSFFRPAPVPEEAWVHMQADAGTWARPDQAPPAGVEGGSGSASSKAKPHKVAPWDQKRDAELSGLETLARDGMRLANASLMTFAHLMNGLVTPDGAMTKENLYRALYTLRDLQHCTGEHFCRIAHQLAFLRKANAVNALNLLNPKPFLEVPIGPDLFGGKFKEMHDKEVADRDKRATLAKLHAKKPATASVPKTKSQAPKEQQTQSFRGQDQRRQERQNPPKGNQKNQNRGGDSAGGKKGGSGNQANRGGGRSGGGGGSRGHTARRK